MRIILHNFNRTVIGLHAMDSPFDHPLLKKVLPGMIQAMEAHPFITNDTVPNMGVDRPILARFLPRILEEVQTKTDYITEATSLAELRDQWEAGEMLRRHFCQLLQGLTLHREGAQAFRDDLLGKIKELDDANEEIAKLVILLSVGLNKQLPLRK